MNNIAGKVIVITGASSGLGEAAAKLLSKEGAIVALGARRAIQFRNHDVLPRRRGAIARVYSGRSKRNIQ